MSMFQINFNFSYPKDHSPREQSIPFNYFLTGSSSTVVTVASSSVQPKSHYREIPCHSFPHYHPFLKINKFALKIIKIYQVRFIAPRPGPGNLEQLIKSPAVSQHSSVVLPDAEKSLRWGYLGLSHQSL